MKTVALWVFVVIWFVNLVLGVGAGYAALRLWYSRHHPLISRLGPYMLAFVVDVLASVVMVFINRGVRLTWKFTTVWFISTLISNVLRFPLVLFLIKGAPRKLKPPETERTEETIPEIWHDRFDRLEMLIQSMNKEIAQMIDNEHTPEGLPDTAPPAETPVGPPDHPQGPPIEPADGEEPGVPQGPGKGGG